MYAQAAELRVEEEGKKKWPQVNAPELYLLIIILNHRVHFLHLYFAQHQIVQIERSMVNIRQQLLRYGLDSDEFEYVPNLRLLLLLLLSLCELWAEHAERLNNHNNNSNEWWPNHLLAYLIS